MKFSVNLSPKIVSEMDLKFGILRHKFPLLWNTVVFRFKQGVGKSKLIA